MRNNPRIIFPLLLAAAAVGLLVGIPLIRIFPPADFAAAHAAATTPVALAMTSHAVEVAGDLMFCVALAWIPTVGGFWLLWRGPWPEKKEALIAAALIFWLIAMGSEFVAGLGRRSTSPIFWWFDLSAAAVMLSMGLFFFAFGLFRFFKPRRRAST